MTTEFGEFKGHFLIAHDDGHMGIGKINYVIEILMTSECVESTFWGSDYSLQLTNLTGKKVSFFGN